MGLNEIKVDKYKKKSWSNFENFVNALYARKNLDYKLNSNPIQLLIDPTNYCNLQCPFCTTGQRKGARKPENMTFDMFRKIIDPLKGDIFHIKFYNWGEPLLNNELPKMIQYVQQYNITSEISTNLSLKLSEKFVRELINSGLDLIIISADGATQQNYEKYRVGGNLDQVFENIRLMSQIKKELNKQTIILWRFLVFKHNQDEIEKAKTIAKELGIDILFATPYVDPSKFDEWASTISQFVPYYWPYPDNKRKLLQPSQKKSEFIHPWKNKLDFPKACDWLWLINTINSNGLVSPCCLSEYENQDYGNLKNNSLITILNNEKFLHSRKLFNESNLPNKGLICDNCPAPEIWNEPFETICLTIKSLIEKLSFDYPYFKDKSINDYDWELLNFLKFAVTQKSQIDDLKNNLNYKEKENKSLKQSLDMIENSKTFKFLRKIDKIQGKT